jgi:hypothetical protein
MKPIKWIPVLGILLLFGCAAPVVTDNPVQREIVRVSVNDGSPEQAPVEVVTYHDTERPDGVLGDSGQCRRLITSEALFSDADAM